MLAGYGAIDKGLSHKRGCQRVGCCSAGYHPFYPSASAVAACLYFSLISLLVFNAATAVPEKLLMAKLFQFLHSSPLSLFNSSALSMAQVRTEVKQSTATTKSPPAYKTLRFIQAVLICKGSMILTAEAWLLASLVCGCDSRETFQQFSDAQAGTGGGFFLERRWI